MLLLLACGSRVTQAGVVPPLLAAATDEPGGTGAGWTRGVCASEGLGMELVLCSVCAGALFFSGSAGGFFFPAIWLCFQRIGVAVKVHSQSSTASPEVMRQCGVRGLVGEAVRSSGGAASCPCGEVSAAGGMGLYFSI